MHIDPSTDLRGTEIGGEARPLGHARDDRSLSPRRDQRASSPRRSHSAERAAEMDSDEQSGAERRWRLLAATDWTGTQARVNRGRAVPERHHKHETHFRHA